jgi:hypothetical protein
LVDDWVNTIRLRKVDEVTTLENYDKLCTSIYIIYLVPPVAHLTVVRLATGTLEQEAPFCLQWRQIGSATRAVGTLVGLGNSATTCRLDWSVATLGFGELWPCQR